MSDSKDHLAKLEKPLWTAETSHHLRFKGHFPGVPELTGAPLALCVHLFQNRIFGDNRHMYFYRPDALPVAQSKISKSTDDKYTAQASIHHKNVFNIADRTRM